LFPEVLYPLLYPYHPLFGKEIEVFGAAGGQRDMIYVRLADSTIRGIPAWMFDPVVCANVRATEQALIESSALLKIAELIENGVPGGSTIKDETAKITNQDQASSSVRRPTVPSVERSGE
jgi:hypothetical protein